MVVLDEAANVCRWPKLPKLYSHYGSRGILIDTILQSYPQGEGVWGKAGMDALLEAANWVAYAGGNKPGHLLTLLSDAVGDYYYSTPVLLAHKGCHVDLARNKRIGSLTRPSCQRFPRAEPYYFLPETGQHCCVPFHG